MYPLVFHPSMSPMKWAGYDTSRQTLTIANELNRAISALERDYMEDARKCYERALELTDITGEDPRWKKRLKELRRFREVLAGLYLEPELMLTRELLNVLLTLDSGAWNLLYDRG